MVKLTWAKEHLETFKQSKPKQGTTLVVGNGNCNQNVTNVPFGGHSHNFTIQKNNSLEKHFKKHFSQKEAIFT